jgi:hypothetical protein
VAARPGLIGHVPFFAPAEESVRRAVAIQMIINKELGLNFNGNLSTPRNLDPRITRGLRAN